MLNIYFGCAAFLFAFLTFMWSARTWRSIFIKLMLFAMCVFSIFFLLQNLGYIVKL